MLEHDLQLDARRLGPTAALPRAPLLALTEAPERVRFRRSGPPARRSDFTLRDLALT